MGRKISDVYGEGRSRSCVCLPASSESVLANSPIFGTTVVTSVNANGFLRVSEGDLVVIIAGSPPGIPGSTNALRIHRMGDAINEVAPAYRRS